MTSGSVLLVRFVGGYYPLCKDKQDEKHELSDWKTEIIKEKLIRTKKIQYIFFQYPLHPSKTSSILFLQQ